MHAVCSTNKIIKIVWKLKEGTCKLKYEEDSSWE